MKLPSTLFIPLGRDSSWSNNELRYALRSWSRYSGVERVLIIGNKPEWYTGDHMQWEQLLPKTEDIWMKTQAACMHIDELFIFGNDDHILTSALTDLPYYHSGPISRFRGGSDTFMRYVDNTAKLLGEPANYYDVHTPMIIEPEAFLDLDFTTDTLLKSVYCNCNTYAIAMSSRIVDPLIRSHIRYDEIESYTRLGMFAFNDNGLSNDLRQWLKDKFPEKSRWER